MAGRRITRFIAANRITPGVAVRRGLALLAVTLLLAAALSACGGDGGGTSTTATDQEADAEVLNEILARQEAAIRAHEVSFPALHKQENLAAVRFFRAQEQEHVDATLKALRGLGAEVDPETEPIPADSRDTEAEFLEFLYELESATMEAEVAAIGKLTAPAARSMLAATVANQAQHLAFLRGALGAGPLQAIPSAFENGTVAVP